MKRRVFISGLGALTAGCQYWPVDGWRNACESTALPESIANHELLDAAWDGVNPATMWDFHVHLLGTGDSGSGAWVSPQLQSAGDLLANLRYDFFLNAACVEADSPRKDGDYLARLLACQAGLGPHTKLVLLAFDYTHSKTGLPQPASSDIYVPNDYARRLAERFPHRLRWAASVHPYRLDALTRLDQAIEQGAVMVKWLPPAQGIDPGSPRCDRFYDLLAARDVPLLSHAGSEGSLRGADRADFGNPLKLRRALDRGVRVVVAHCASLGSGIDLDHGPNGPRVANFELFSRLMDEPRYEQLVFGDLAGITQSDRFDPALGAILERPEWHHRLLNGSDYPLPGLVPAFSVRKLTDSGLLDPREAEVIASIRPHNPLLFDFVLKRRIRRGTRRFETAAFETRSFLERS